MALIKWDPFREFNALTERFGNFPHGFWEVPASTTAWNPSVDIFRRIHSSSHWCVAVGTTRTPSELAPESSAPAPAPDSPNLVPLPECEASRH